MFPDHYRSGRTVTYAWDIEGRRSAVTYPVSGDEIIYTRDDIGRADKITREGSEVVDYTFNGYRVIKKAYPGSHGEFMYDAIGRPEKLLYKDSSSGNTLVQTDLVFDDAHQIVSQDKLYYDDVQNTRLTADTEDLGDQYAYDEAKRLVTVLRGVPTDEIGETIATNFTNDDFDEFVKYTYDETGNRTTREIDDKSTTVTTTYAHNKVNEMTKQDALPDRLYTDNGSFRGGDTLPTENRFRYSYADQLSQFTKSNIPPDVIYSWHYDAFGRVIQRDKSRDQRRHNAMNI